MSFLTGFLTWTHRSALSRQEVDEDKQRFQKALDAEDTLGDLVGNLGHLKENIHLRKRVYVAEQHRNREIDVIAVCDALYVVEVKNWTGDIWRNGERWFQLPPRANAKALEFGDVLAECEFKARALVRHLLRHGIEMPAGSVRAVVVFAHPKARLCPTSLLTCPSILTKESFEQLVGQRKSWRDVFTSVAPSVFASRAELTPPLRRQISECINRVRTWDTIRMHNGELHTGDVEWICLVEYTDWKLKHDKVNWLKVKRNAIEKCTTSWASSRWWGVATSMWQGSAGVLVLQLDPSVKLISTAQAAIDEKRAAKGGKKSGAAAPVADSTIPDPPAVHNVPLSTKSSKRPAVEVNHVVFRPAGSPSSVSFALSEIAVLDLSPHDEA